MSASLADAYNNALKKLERLKKKNTKIIACYLFGSYVKNPKKARDIDLCIISKGMSSDEMASIAMEFNKPIDISFMERMPYYIAINVFRNGKPIFINKKDELAKKWKEIVHTYLMYAPMRERVFKGVLRWMNLSKP